MSGCGSFAGWTGRRAARPWRSARVYVSDQGHFSVARALDELGFPPRRSSRCRATTGSGSRAGPLATAIAADRARGLTPFAVVAVAGTTNTGSIDDVPAIAEVAAAAGLWLHVDAAYGGAARLSGELAPLVPGLELADSVTVDPHKWFFQAYDIGGLMVRDGRLLEQTFSRRPEYYRGGGDTAREHDAHDSDSLDFYRLGFEGTRRWRALKLWMSWKHLGTRGLGRLVEANVAIAKYLSEQHRGQRRLRAAARRLRSCRWSASVTSRGSRVRRPMRWMPTRTRCRRHSRRTATAGCPRPACAARHGCEPGVINPMTTEADIDRLLAGLRRLADAAS